MDFTAKYTTLAASTLPENKEKIVISQDTYALGEVINDLIKMLWKTKK